MPGKLTLLLRSKLALAALAAILVVGGGTTVALAAASNQGNHQQTQHTPGATQGQSSSARSHDGNDDHSRGSSQDSRQIEGAISSIDAGASSFVVASEHSGAVMVVVTANTVFDDDVSGFADLKVGMFVEVNGNFQTDNRLTATRIERGNDANDATGDDHPGGDHPGGDDHRGSGSGGSGGSGRGGHDDGIPHS